MFQYYILYFPLLCTSICGYGIFICSWSKTFFISFRIILSASNCLLDATGQVILYTTAESPRLSIPNNLASPLECGMVEDRVDTNSVKTVSTLSLSSSYPTETSTIAKELFKL